MIEQGLYFALGCVITALAALLFAPVFWQRAMRLTRQRLQLQVPLSMQEILAERDQLRAEFAVERWRLDTAMERLQVAKATDMATIGRQSIETVALNDQIAALRQAEETTERELGRLMREAAETQAQHGTLQAQIAEGQASLDSLQQRFDEVRDQRDRFLTDMDSHRTTSASLKTLVAGLEVKVMDGERALAREKESGDTLRARLETAMAHVARHENAGILMRRELDDAKTHRRQMENEFAASRAALREARQDHQDAVNLQRRLATEHEGAKVTLQRDLDEANAHAQSGRDELVRVRGALAEAQAARDAADKAGRKLEAEHRVATEALRRDIAEANAQTEAERVALVRVQTTLDEAQKKHLADHRFAAEAWSRELDEAKRHTKAGRAELTRVQSALDEAETAREAADKARRLLEADHGAETEAWRRDLADAEAQILRLRGELSTAQGSLNNARERERIADTERRRLAEREAEVAKLKKDMVDAGLRASELEGVHIAAQASLKELRAAHEEAAGSRLNAQTTHQAATDALTADLAAATAQVEALRQELATAHGKGETALATQRGLQEAQEASALRLRHDLDVANLRVRQLEGDLTAVRRSLDDAEERERASRLQKSLQTQKTRRDEQTFAERLDRLAAENKALQATLAEVQSDGGTAEQTAAPEDDAALRSSIHALGVAVARLTRQARATEPAEREVRKRPSKGEKRRPMGVA